MQYVKRAITKIDYILSEKYINSYKGRAYVQILMFHKIFKSRSDIRYENGDPLEAIDLLQFEQIIKFFYKRRVKFIDEEDILNDKLEIGQSYIYVTFDDGYFNNFNCLDILEKYGAKATFMISTNHVRENRAFWWDVTYREIWKENLKETEDVIFEKIKNINTLLYGKKWEEQGEFLKKRFCLETLSPQNDVDRPMREEELREFAKHPLVRIGNHTNNHINLTLYGQHEIIESIQSASEYLGSFVPRKILSFSYPHGFFNDDCINIVDRLGFKIGLTVNRGQHRTSILKNKSKLLTLNRIDISGNIPIEPQLRRIHTNFSLFNRIRRKMFNFQL